MYPVEVAYAVDPTPDYVQMAAELAFKINRQVYLCVLYRNHPTNCCQVTIPGDILIFLAGREEIERCLEELAELIAA